MNERSVFLEALEKEGAAERAAFLDQACAGEAELRQRVERLLAAHAESGSLFGALPQLGATVDEEPKSEGRAAWSGRTSCCSKSARAAWAPSSWPSSKSPSAARSP
jgi:hypothetical protein